MNNKSKGWIGVDLDGTLAVYDGWVDAAHIGEPIPVMAARVKQWLADDIEVRIFTARVGEAGRSTLTVDQVRYSIQEWTFKHFGRYLPVTNLKDFSMYELWDDRAIQVITNTGQRVDWNDTNALQRRLMELFQANPPPEVGERLINWLEVSSRLGEMSAKELVDVALTHLSDSVSEQHYEQVVEELCTRVHPNWSNEDPSLPDGSGEHSG